MARMVTADDKSPLIVVIAWFLMVAMIVSVLTRLLIRKILTRALGSDDVTVVAAMVFAIAQIIAISSATNAGLGKHEDSLTPVQITKVEKAQYASELLFIIAVCLGKLSILQLLRKLVVVKSQEAIASLVMLVVIVWTIAGFFTLAFQCGSSKPWSATPGKCINISAFWAAMTPVDILTEMAMMILPIVMIWRVRIDISSKLIVVGAFAFRIFVVTATIARVVYIHRDYVSADRTFSASYSSIATQFVVNLSIISACIPSLKPFLDSFDTGMLNISLYPRNPPTNDTSSFKRERTQNSGEEAFLPKVDLGHETEDLGTSMAIERIGCDTTLSYGSSSTFGSEHVIMHRPEQ